MLLALCLLACNPNDSLRALRPSTTEAQQPVTNGPGCATVVMAVSGSSGATAVFPADSACRTGLVLVAGGAASYSRPGGGHFTLPVRVVNRSGAAVAGPIRLELSTDSAVVLSPPGLAKNGKKGVTPTSADSVLASGTLWLVPATTLGVGDTSAPRSIEFTWDNGVHQVRLGLGLSATEAAPPDTGRPVLPDSVPSLTDTAHVVRNPADTVRIYFRRYIGIRFQDSTSGASIRSIFASIGAQVVGGAPFVKEYTLLVPDLGPDFGAFVNRIRTLEQDPRIDYVAPYLARDAQPVLHGRYPVDGSGHRREDWFDIHSTHNWALRAIRAGLAWGCETAANKQTTVGALEWAADVNHRELSSTQPTVVLATPQPIGTPLPTTDFIDLLFWHGTAVAGVIAAAPGDSYSVAGLMWRPNLFLYEIGVSQSADPLNQSTQGDAVRALGLDLIPRMATAPLRVLSISSDVAEDPALPGATQRVRAAFAALLTKTPGLLIIKATGDDGLTITTADLQGLHQGGTVILAALASLRTDPSLDFGNRIMFVAGTEDPNGNGAGNEWWGEAGSGSTLIQNMTDLAAPASEIDLLGRADPTSPRGFEIETASGTSFSAPMVAGVAGLLASFDPSLSPADIRQLLLDGARLPKPAPGGIGLTTPQPVHDVPDGEAIYQLDAYSSLKLAAQRVGAPLCDNHVWDSGDSVIVRRTPSVTETIAAGLGISHLIATYHGGRRIDVSPAGNSTLAYTGGQWQLTPFAGFDSVGLSGASRSAQGLSHDGDTLAVLHQLSFNPNPVVAVELTDLSSGQTTQLTTFNAWFPNYDGVPTHTISYAGYSSATNTLVVPIRPGNGPGPAVDFYSVAIPSGQTRLLWSVPDAHGIGVGASEDGQEAIVNYWNYDANFDPMCIVEYRSMADGSLIDQSQSRATGPGTCIGQNGAITPTSALSATRSGPWTIFDRPSGQR